MNFAQIKKIAKKIQIDKTAIDHSRILTDAEAALENSKKTKSAVNQPKIWRIVVKNRIAQLAAAVVVVLAACWLIVSDKSILEQHETTGSEIAVISETPAELVSVITLNMAFRDGGMQAMEKQFDKAEEKVKPGLKTRLTVDELICELYGC